MEHTGWNTHIAQQEIVADWVNNLSFLPFHRSMSDAHFLFGTRSLTPPIFSPIGVDLPVTPPTTQETPS